MCVCVCVYWDRGPNQDKSVNRPRQKFNIGPNPTPLKYINVPLKLHLAFGRGLLFFFMSRHTDKNKQKMKLEDTDLPKTKRHVN